MAYDIFWPNNLKKVIKKCHNNKKPKIVVTGINLDSGGTLSIFNDVLYNLSESQSHKYDIYAFCSSNNKLRFNGIEYVEFYWSKKSYLIRLIIEKVIFHQFSKRINVKLWLSMHDITPRVNASSVVTYVHNPAPFYKFKIRDFYFSPTFGLFVLFYKYIYMWGINKNDYLIVQQTWMKNQFDVLAPKVKKIISKPKFTKKMRSDYSKEPVKASSINGCFFYPTLSRPFKKIENFLKIAEFFYRLDYLSFDFYLTLTGKENNYSRWLYKKFGHLPNVVWLGKIDREEVFNLYERSDCLIFTSHLETWGLPLTEFSLTKKTIIAPNLPYVHETLAGYPKLLVYNADDVIQLLKLSLKVANKIDMEYSATREGHSDHCSVDGWDNLLSLIIE